MLPDIFDVASGYHSIYVFICLSQLFLCVKVVPVSVRLQLSRKLDELVDQHRLLRRLFYFHDSLLQADQVLLYLLCAVFNLPVLVLERKLTDSL